MWFYFFNFIYRLGQITQSFRSDVLHWFSIIVRLKFYFQQEVDNYKLKVMMMKMINFIIISIISKKIGYDA